MIVAWLRRIVRAWITESEESLEEMTDDDEDEDEQPSKGFSVVKSYKR